jgi:hypothetical protein
METLADLPTKIQYLNIDSQFVSGTNSDFAVNFGIGSNVFIQEMKDVIGIKVVDFYITQVGANGLGTDDVAKYVDIVCPDIPLAAQILDERKGQVLARIPIECNFQGGDLFVKHDRHWDGFTRKTNYFNPISLKQLRFAMYELQGDGDYVPLQSDSAFYFTLEITTIDHKAPTPDKNLLVIEAIDRLGRKIDRLNANVKKIPPPPPPSESNKKKIPLLYVGAVIAAVAAAYIYFTKYRTQIRTVAIPSR